MWPTPCIGERKIVFNRKWRTREFIVRLNRYCLRTNVYNSSRRSLCRAVADRELRVARVPFPPVADQTRVPGHPSPVVVTRTRRDPISQRWWRAARARRTAAVASIRSRVRHRHDDDDLSGRTRTADDRVVGHVRTTKTKTNNKTPLSRRQRYFIPSSSPRFPKLCVRFASTIGSTLSLVSIILRSDVLPVFTFVRLLTTTRQVTPLVSVRRIRVYTNVIIKNLRNRQTCGLITPLQVPKSDYSKRETFVLNNRPALITAPIY